MRAARGLALRISSTGRERTLSLRRLIWKMSARSNSGRFSPNSETSMKIAITRQMELRAQPWLTLVAASITSTTRINPSFWSSKMWLLTKVQGLTVPRVRTSGIVARISTLKILSFCLNCKGLKTRWCAAYWTTTSSRRRTVTSGTCCGRAALASLTSTRV